jgi:hypothetical protein
MRNAYTISVEESEDYREVGCENANLICLAEDRVQCRLVWHGNEPSSAIKGGELHDRLSDS